MPAQGAVPAAQLGVEQAPIQTHGQAGMESMMRIPERKPRMIIPYVPGIGQKLKRIANQYNIETWYTFLGKLSQQFTQHRGKQHHSKIQNCVYQAHCSCGVQYVGEWSRNLKTRLAEHRQKHSKSALSMHLRQNDDHSATMHDTLILARERNSLKRKVLESLCIEHKKARLCNTGVSIEMPVIWNICVEGLGQQLAHFD